MNKLVSIIMPVYNSEKTLTKSLNSLIKQSYESIEIIVINDGSTDSSLDVLKKEALNDKRIKVIDKKNGGVSSARNVGINHAQGDYIMFIDADDTLDENAVETCINNIEKYDLIKFLANEICLDKTIKLYNCIYNDYKEDVILASDAFDHLISGKVSGHCWTYFYKTDIIKNNNIEFDNDIFYGEDYLFVLNYIKKSDKIKLIKKPFYNYYVGENTITQGFENKVRNMKTLPLLKSKVLEIIGNNEKSIDIYNKTLLQLLVYYYSVFANNLSRKEFKKLILDLNKTEMKIFNSIKKETLGKGSKIFLFLNQKSCINLLYFYMFIFNKLKW